MPSVAPAARSGDPSFKQRALADVVENPPELLAQPFQPELVHLDPHRAAAMNAALVGKLERNTETRPACRPGNRSAAQFGLAGVSRRNPPGNVVGIPAAKARPKPEGIGTRGKPDIGGRRRGEGDRGHNVSCEYPLPSAEWNDFTAQKAVRQGSEIVGFSPRDPKSRCCAWSPRAGNRKCAVKDR